MTSEYSSSVASQRQIIEAARRLASTVDTDVLPVALRPLLVDLRDALSVSAPSKYQIALREDDLGLDDVVVHDVAMFRMERMDDDYVWLACYLTDGQEIVFDLWREKKVIKYAARQPLPNVVYE